jgi:hypothetical protein
MMIGRLMGDGADAFPEGIGTWRGNQGSRQSVPLDNGPGQVTLLNVLSGF